MEPEAFISEVYRRMSALQAVEQPQILWQDLERSPMVRRTMEQYRDLLPEDKDAAILDIGVGKAWFLAACIKLGYTNISGAEFDGRKQYMESWSPAIRKIYSVETNIGDLLKVQPERFDFIHFSHVLEHIPKYNLLHVCDALYLALRPGGVLLVRTPNMEGPCANSSLFVTLAHEYGFSGSNLLALLKICQFDDIRFEVLAATSRAPRQLLGFCARWVILRWSALKHRLFGVNKGGQFGAELVVSARRGEKPPLFDEKYR